MSLQLAPDRADLRLAGPVAAVWALAAVLVGVPSAAVSVVLATSSLAVGGLVALVALRARHTVSRRWVPVTSSLLVTTSTVGALVAVAVAVGSDQREPEPLRDLPTRAVAVEVGLDRDLTPGDRSVTGTLRRAAGAGGLRVPVRVVPAFGDAPDQTLPAGTALSGRAVVEPDEPGSPTSFVVFLRDDPVAVPPTGLLAATGGIRSSFVTATEHLPEPGAALLRGLAIGDRGGLDTATEAAMETSALTHLTAVSGANCAVIVGIVMVVGRSVGLPRSARAGVAIAFLLAFVVLVRPDPSIVRATVMAVIVCVVHLVGRPVRGVPLIALAVAAMLVVDPWYARSFAFALSVLATTGIVVLGPPLTALLARRVWTPAAAVTAVPVAAQLACWPVTIPLSAALPTYAVPANLLTEPLAPIVTVIGLGACLVAPVWPWGAEVLAAIAWVPASAIGGVAHGAAALPWASAPWPSGVVGVAGAAIVSGSSAAAVLVRPAVRLRLLLVAAVVGVLGVAVVAVPTLVVRGSVPSDWSVAACDVGQGDAVLLRDGSSTALVDTGDEPELLRSCLELLGVSTIDLLVLTHFDRDHVGALDEVAGRTVTALVGPTGRPEDDRVVRTLQEHDVDVRRAAEGTTGTLGALEWRVLWPRSGAGAREAGNDASVVLRTEPGADCRDCLTTLLLGDLGEASQRRLRADRWGPVDVVKVSHHGSADQDPRLYRAVGARVGLIGVGADNGYGHPTPTALDALADAGTTAFRTDEQGTIVVSGSGAAGLRVWTARSASAGARRIDAASGAADRSASGPD